MEPLFPTARRGRLAELSAEIFRRSGELTSSLPSLAVRQELAKLVREMNSYYSNLIEGHKTLPKDIERAMRNDFSTGPDDLRNQKLSVAHIQTEGAMRARLSQSPTLDVYSAEFICWLHGEFYSHIPETEWFTTSESGARHALAPGRLRNHDVDVGKHTPPDHTTLDAFMQRFHASYSAEGILATDRLVALAAAHHRLAWIHPFGDGNGRVARLQSQAAMLRAGVDGEGLWTLSRGVARARASYYARLQNADGSRANDYDGRGNLTDIGLADFCVFFLEQILDQMDFMIGLIDPFKLQERIGNYFQFVRLDLEGRMRGHLAKLMQALCMQGEIPRGKVPELLGLKGTAGREVIKKAQEERLVTSASEKSALRIAFPSEVTEFYFPGLFTDLPVG